MTCIHNDIDKILSPKLSGMLIIKSEKRGPELSMKLISDSVFIPVLQATLILTFIFPMYGYE